VRDRYRKRDRDLIHGFESRSGRGVNHRTTESPRRAARNLSVRGPAVEPYETTMKYGDRNDPKDSDNIVRQSYAVGLAPLVSAAVMREFPLITPRSLVQIQPPQPRKVAKPKGSAEMIGRPLWPSIKEL
jgi:hypothetical protein